MICLCIKWTLHGHYRNSVVVYCRSCVCDDNKHYGLSWIHMYCTIDVVCLVQCGRELWEIHGININTLNCTIGSIWEYNEYVRNMKYINKILYSFLTLWWHYITVCWHTWKLVLSTTMLYKHNICTILLYKKDDIL